MHQRKLTEDTVHRIIEMAWEDRTPIDAIKKQFSLSEKQIILLMRRYLRPASFRNWRKRVAGRKTKHLALEAKLFLAVIALSNINKKLDKLT